MMSEELKKFRAQIDAIDDELLKLVNLRAKLAQDIGHAKKGSVVLRPEREAQVLQRLVAANTGPLPPQSITALFTEIMSHCRALEEPLSVAYLGPEGTFSEEAARRRFGSAISGSPCNSFDEVFREVESGRSKYGMVPVENSSEGAIGHILDLLVGSLLKVCGEEICRCTSVCFRELVSKTYVLFIRIHSRWDSVMSGLMPICPRQCAILYRAMPKLHGWQPNIRRIVLQ
jgi:chorismate mutase/prephenate dehydratase